MAEVITNMKESYFNSVNSFQWMLDESAAIHFTLVDFHVTLGCNQRPTVGNIAGCHVCIVNVLTNNTVYLTYNNALHMTLSATAETQQLFDKTATNGTNFTCNDCFQRELGLAPLVFFSSFNWSSLLFFHCAGIEPLGSVAHVVYGPDIILLPMQQFQSTGNNLILSSDS